VRRFLTKDLPARGRQRPHQIDAIDVHGLEQPEARVTVAVRLVPVDGLDGRRHLLVGDAGHRRGAPAQVVAAALTSRL